MQLVNTYTYIHTYVAREERWFEEEHERRTTSRISMYLPARMLAGAMQPNPLRSKKIKLSVFSTGET